MPKESFSRERLSASSHHIGVGILVETFLEWAWHLPGCFVVCIPMPLLFFQNLELTTILKEKTI